MHVLPLFPSLLFSTTIEEDTDELKEDKTCLNSYESGKESEKEDIRVLERYPNIKKILLNEWNSLVKVFLKYDNEFIISTSWITNTYPDSYSQKHIHKHSFYSGIYYFDEYSEESAKIEIANPLTDKENFNLIPTEYNMNNSKVWWVQPTPKQLIFFPSYLEHQILKQQDDAIRKSLAFNIIPTGEYGQADSFINTSWFKN